LNLKMNAHLSFEMSVTIYHWKGVISRDAIVLILPVPEKITISGIALKL